jgi:hypothetical protein
MRNCVLLPRWMPEAYRIKSSCWSSKDASRGTGGRSRGVANGPLKKPSLRAVLCTTSQSPLGNTQYPLFDAPPFGRTISLSWLKKCPSRVVPYSTLGLMDCSSRLVSTLESKRSFPLFQPGSPGGQGFPPSVTYRMLLVG